MRFEDFDTLLINKGFLNDTKRTWPVYCLRYNSRCMQQIHIRGGGPNEVVAQQKILLNPVTEKIDEFKQRRFAKM